MSPHPNHPITVAPPPANASARTSLWWIEIQGTYTRRIGMPSLASALKILDDAEFYFEHLRGQSHLRISIWHRDAPRPFLEYAHKHRQPVYEGLAGSSWVRRRSFALSDLPPSAKFWDRADTDPDLPPTHLFHEILDWIIQFLCRDVYPVIPFKTETAEDILSERDIQLIQASMDETYADEDDETGPLWDPFDDDEEDPLGTPLPPEE